MALGAPVITIGVDNELEVKDLTLKLEGLKVVGQSNSLSSSRRVVLRTCNEVVGM